MAAASQDFAVEPVGPRIGDAARAFKAGLYLVALTRLAPLPLDGAPKSRDFR